MSTENKGRTEIPGGEQDVSWHHLIPVARFLIERGHPAIDEAEKFGFVPSEDGMICQLAHKITFEDWRALNEAFALPANIGFFGGIIRDNDNWVDIIGYDTVQDEDGPIPTRVWEERERKAGRL